MFQPALLHLALALVPCIYVRKRARLLKGKLGVVCSEFPPLGTLRPAAGAAGPTPNPQSQGRLTGPRTAEQAGSRTGTTDPGVPFASLNCRAFCPEAISV